MSSPGNRRVGIIFAGAVFGAFNCALAIAQNEAEFSISPSPVGSGARAAGMGDAFVAVADDATAASWNPAGLVQLERPEISIVGQYNYLHDDFHSPPNPEFEDTFYTDALDLNFMSAVYPIPRTIWGRNVTLGLSYQQKYLLDREIAGFVNTVGVTEGGSPFTLDQSLDFTQEGNLGVLTPSVAVDLTNSLAVGLSVNLWRSWFENNGWKQEQVSFDHLEIDFGPPIGVLSSDDNRVVTEEYEDLRAENFVFGVLWDVSERWKLAFRYDSGFTSDVDYRSTVVDLDTPGPPVFDEENRNVRFPATFAVGASYRPNDKLTLSMDLSTTDWDNYYVQEEDGTKFSLVDSHVMNDPAVGHAGVDFDRTYTLRFGWEYVLIPRNLEEDLPRLWTLRGGLFYDQEPATNRERNSVLSPGDGEPDDFYGAAAGIGLQLGQRVNLDWAYQIRYGNDVNTDFFRGVRGFSDDYTQHRVLFSTVIYF